MHQVAKNYSAARAAYATGIKVVPKDITVLVLRTVSDADKRVPYAGHKIASRSAAMGCTMLGDRSGETVSISLVADSTVVLLNTHRTYLEKIVPDLDNESANLEHVSTFNLIRERQRGHLGPLKPQYPIATPLWPNFSHSSSHVSSGMSPETMGTPTRHVRGRGEGPWLANTSRQNDPPQHASAHSTPRISSYSVLPRIRASNSTDHSRRPFDEWAIPEKSYPTTPSLLPTLGHPHAARAVDPNNSPQFLYVKHEPDIDLTTPPPRLGWTCMGHQGRQIPAFVFSCNFNSSCCIYPHDLGGRPATCREADTVRALHEITQAYLCLVTCSSLGEIPQLLRTRNMSSPSEITC